MKKIKESGIFDKRILIPVAVLLLLGGFAFWAVKDAEKINPIEEDSKQAEKEIEKREKEDRDALKKEIGKDYPTVEEVERFQNTIPSDQNPLPLMEKEFGREVMEQYVSGNLLSTHDTGDIRTIKEGKLKRALDGKGALGSLLDIASGTDTVMIEKPMMTVGEGFKDIGEGLKAGYSVIRPLVGAEDIFGEDKKIHYIEVRAMALEDMTAKEFKEKAEIIRVEVNGKKAHPGFNEIHNIEKTEEHEKGAEEFKKFDEKIGVLGGHEYWQESGNEPEDMMVYAGTVLGLMYEIDMAEVFPGIVLNEDGDIEGIPEEFTLKVGEQEFTVSGNIDAEVYNVRL